MKKKFYNIKNFYDNLSQEYNEAFFNINKIIAYIYYKKNSFNYDYETNKYRNNFLFNFNHSRFYNKNIRYKFDPLIYEQNTLSWPEYVTEIYYTNLTYNNEIVQLSYKNNLFLNKCFNHENDSYVSLYRIGYYAIYEYLSENKKENNIEDKILLNYFANKNKIINNYENVDFYYKNYYINNYNKKKYNIISSKKTELLTTWAYKNFYDYIPICYVLQDYNPRFMYTSNICYHNNNCHDYSCHTHNNIYTYNSHPHYDFQSIYKFNNTQIIDILNLT